MILFFRALTMSGIRYSFRIVEPDSIDVESVGWLFVFGLADEA